MNDLSVSFIISTEAQFAACLFSTSMQVLFVLLEKKSDVLGVSAREVSNMGSVHRGEQMYTVWCSVCVPSYK